MAKARLVIKSFEEICNEEISKDVATCSKEAQRIMLALIAQKKKKKTETEYHWYRNCLFAKRKNWQKSFCYATQRSRNK